MSLKSRDEERGGDPSLNQRRRKADIMKEKYERSTMESLIRHAEYKQSVGMELNDSERFVIENKAFLLRKQKMMMRYSVPRRCS